MDPSGNAHSPQNNNSVSRKRGLSLGGFLEKIIPTHRPEQGGTLRNLANASTESAYRDLNINPEELKDWNIAQDLPIHQRLGLDDDHARFPHRSVPTRPRTSPSPRRRGTPFLGTKPYMSATEAQSLLETKQRSRRHRRELKGSGDWLGVTGANPHTGEYNVLTPDDLLSSDTTRSSTKLKMKKLTKSVRHAEDEYEKAKRAEDAARENHMAEKAQAKLARIEQTKAEIQQQHGHLAWRRNRREWSYAQEPQLSPIAQSFMNTELDDQPQDHIIENVLPVSHTENKGKDPVRASPSSRNSSGKVNKLQKRRRNADLSADTIIHTPSRQRSRPVSPNQGQGNGDTKPDAQDPNPLRMGKPFLWMRRRRATDPGGRDTNQATVTSLLMTEEKDHFNGLIIPDSCLEFPATQTGKDPLEENNGCPQQWSDGLDMIEDGNQIPPPSSQGDKRISKDRDQPNAVATVISSQSTLKEHTKNRFAARQKLDRSRSASDLVKKFSKPQHPVRQPGGSGMFHHKTYSQVDVRKVETSEENPSRPQGAENQIETPLPDSLAPQERSRQGRDTARKADVELDKKEITLRAIHPSDEIPREVEGERTPKWSNRIIETITSSGETHRNKDSVYTPTITTIGCAQALLIQPIPGAILGQVDEPTDLRDTPVTQRLNSKSPRPLGRWIKKAEDVTALSRPTTTQSAWPRHGYSRSVPICGTASPRIVEIRRPNSSEGRQSLLARGTLRNKSKESKPAQTTSPTKHHAADTQSGEKHREATAQGAAQTAMLQSQAKTSIPKESPIKVFKTINESKTEAKQENNDAVVGLSTPPKSPKRDAMGILHTMVSAIISWVWSTIKMWWAVMRPVFDGDSELWKRRHQEESTWFDVGAFVFTGVSLVVGLTLGAHILGAVRSFL